MKPQALLEKAKTLDESMSHKMRMLSNARYADNKVVWGNQSYNLTPEAETQFLENLRIPAPYWTRIDPELKSISANHLMKQAEKEVMVHSIENGDKNIMGFQNPTSPILSMERAVSTILESVPENGWKIHNGDITGSLCRVSLVTPRKEEVKKNDIVQFGMNVWLFPTGDHLPKVEQFSLRLVCTNGMTVPETYGRGEKNWGREPEEVYYNLSNAVNNVFAEMEDQSILERFKEMASHKLETEEDIRKEMDRLFKMAQVPKHLRGRAWEIFHAEEEYSRWGAVNALTRLANEQTLPLSDVRELQGCAGGYSRIHHCKLCGHSI